MPASDIRSQIKAEVRAGVEARVMARQSDEERREAQRQAERDKRERLLGAWRGAIREQVSSINGAEMERIEARKRDLAGRLFSTSGAAARAERSFRSYLSREEHEKALRRFKSVVARNRDMRMASERERAPERTERTLDDELNALASFERGRRPGNAAAVKASKQRAKG